ncbi:MAG TPA: phosphate ABC transporter permease subunit PstC [Dongiaceae bacterium]|jgi:phosphate transport system permease protein|nr:phosphate ABC transporter permease subunit PstC [Dongiaceae bacterium]
MKRGFAFAFGLVAVVLTAAPAMARDQLHIVGSSTVYPFSTTVAEALAKQGVLKSPVVEATGTGGGFKLFCGGVGEDTPDLAGASRKIKQGEIDTCAKNGVAKITEIPIGHDGIVIASAKSGPDFTVTRAQMFLALAKNVPQNGQLVPNHYHAWNEIDPSLPAERIEVLGPPPTSGTRDAFVELVMDKGCETSPEIAVLDADAKKAACQQVREDGAYIDAGENDNLIVQKLQANPAAFGIFGYSFLEQNADTLKAAQVEGVAPTYETISGKQYPVARELYIYVKDAHRSIVPGIDAFVRELLSERSMGTEGYLADKGLVPFTPDERKQIESTALTSLGLTALAASGGTESEGALGAALQSVSGSTGTTATAVLVAVIGLSLIGFFMGRARAVSKAGGELRKLHSLPNYHGFYVALWCGLPALLLSLVWLVAQPAIVTEAAKSAMPAERVASLDENQLSLLLSEVRQAAAHADLSQVTDPAVRAGADTYRTWDSMSHLGTLGAAVALALLGIGFAYSRINVEARSRNRVERIVLGVLFACSSLAILTTVGIVLSLVFESLRFFAKIPVTEFLFGLQWSPQMALRADQVGSSGAFGAIPVISGTLLITFIALVVAVPTGLMIAVYLSDYATSRVRSIFKPLVEILAGIPTVVYGFFAALTIGPIFRHIGEAAGLSVASESALAAGLIMGVMIIPFVSSLSDDVMNAVPQALRDGSFALGATRSETIKQVVFPAALPGIVGAVLLATSRAIGETMIVVMAAGLAANLTINPLQAVTTVTVQIVTLLVGDQEFDSPKTLAAFALGLLLFVVTLCLNIVALNVVRRYREKYD